MSRTQWSVVLMAAWLGSGCGGIEYDEAGDPAAAEDGDNANNNGDVIHDAGVTNDVDGDVVNNGVITNNGGTAPADGVYHVDSLILSRPAGPAALLNGIVGPSIFDGGAVILVQLSDSSSRAGVGSLVVTSGVGVDNGDGTYSWANGSGGGGVPGFIDASGHFSSDRPAERLDLPLTVGLEPDAISFTFPLREISFSGTVGPVGIVRGDMTAVIDVEDASQVIIDLGDPPPSLADILNIHNADVDTDGDGVNDGWVLDGRFEGAAVPLR